MKWRNDDPREVYVDMLVPIIVMDGPGSVFSGLVNTKDTGNFCLWKVSTDALLEDLDPDDTWPDWWWWQLEQKLWQYT